MSQEDQAIMRALCQDLQTIDECIKALQAYEKRVDKAHELARQQLLTDLGSSSSNTQFSQRVADRRIERMRQFLLQT